MKALQVHPRDDVAVAIEHLTAGEKITVSGREIILKSDVPRGHKFAIHGITPRQEVVKYGYSIGRGSDRH